MGQRGGQGVGISDLWGAPMRDGEEAIGEGG